MLSEGCVFKIALGFGDAGACFGDPDLQVFELDHVGEAGAQAIEALLEELCACLTFLGVEGEVEHFAIPIAQRPATG